MDVVIVAALTLKSISFFFFKGGNCFFILQELLAISTTRNNICE